MLDENEFPWEEEENEEEELDEDIDLSDFDDDKQFVFHCKPCYNFQSIEFDFVGSYEQIDDMIEIYKTVLDKLAKIAPAQPNNNKPTEALATDRQKEIMKQYGIKFTASTTLKEAQKLINESIGK